MQIGKVDIFKMIPKLHTPLYIYNEQIHLHHKSDISLESTEFPQYKLIILNLKTMWTYHITTSYLLLFMQAIQFNKESISTNGYSNTLWTN